MNRLLKYIFIGTIAIIFSLITYFTYGVVRYSHVLSFQTYKHYLWIFKDSAKKDLDTTFCYSYVGRGDIYNYFNLKGINNILIWEFRDQSISELEDVIFIQNANLANVKFRSGQILDKDTDLEVNIKNGFVLGNSIEVFLDEYSKIERNFKGSNYKGFYGFINKMALSDKRGGHQIIFDYTKGPTPTVVLLYKRYQSLYLIICNSNNQFDESIIHILNLR